MGFESAIAGWEMVGAVDPKTLTGARLSAHRAAQLIGGVGEALVPAEEDFSHTTMAWWNDRRMLVGQLTPEGTRVALRMSDLTMHVMAGGDVQTSVVLAGMTLRDGFAWVTDELEKIHGPLETKPAVPTHGSGDAFAEPDTEALEELARYYANAARFQSVVSSLTLGASPVRCWPHHFDIATLVTLDPPEIDPEEARSIGFGLSPGDTSYDEPYFYINPWPYPEEREGYPELGGQGHWHAEGWFGAVLPASSLGDRSKLVQARQVFAYIKSAFATNRSILEAL